MINLEQVAEANIPHIEEAFATVLAQLSSAQKQQVEEFVQWVEYNCTITVNTKPHVLRILIESGTYVNIYTAAQKYSGAFGLSKEELVRAWLGSYHERRLKFDRAFESGDRFNYGALTAGKGGVREYDSYCLRLRADFAARASTLAYFPGDTLTICFTTAGDFDEQMACSMITPHSHRQILAGNKHWAKVLTVQRHHWPLLINAKSDYIEAVFVAGLTLADVDRVELLRSEYDRVLGLLLRTVNRKLESAEHTLIDTFYTILTAASQNIIELEFVS